MFIGGIKLISGKGCPLTEGKIHTSKILSDDVLGMVKNKRTPKMNAMWLEVTGCSGNIISFLNSENPGTYDILTDIVNFTFNNTLMGAEGNFAFEKFLETLDTEFILLVDGAVSTKEKGRYNIVANYNGTNITALDAIQLAGGKAKYVVAVGTCASHGGISAAKPNPSESKSVQEVLSRQVIKLPGCPCHPDWVVGTIAHLVGYGMPELDDEGRPLLFYGVTIHDNCTRRGFFDKGIFAQKFGEEGCMIKLGCKGPVTKTDCPRRKWNGYVNWPIGDNTNCIRCAQAQFPDGMEPFVKY
ncbi:MAG: hydrogenase small subunit [Clostridium butyricum]|nr:hydrogenase small subunit [Clostridium butyricum]